MENHLSMTGWQKLFLYLYFIFTPSYNTLVVQYNTTVVQSIIHYI